MLIRILASVILLFSIIFMPFWISILLALAGMIYFNIFWEANMLFLLSDLLYGTKRVGLNNMIFVSFITSVIALALIEILKKKIKFYK